MGGTLDDYRRKRDFARTPEPAPRVPSARGAGPVFVVHRHEARALHYDLRIEMAGVLKSFAVPRGFSYDPQDKRLAVRTEDHPLEYEGFSGMIPKGEYGGGTMTIWDRGHYAVVGGADPLAGIEAGKLELELFGRRLRGEWHLVRTKQNWLLFKARDRHAATDGAPALAMDLTAAVEAELDAAVAPMTSGVDAATFSDPDWVFEMEFAGERALACKQGGEVAYLRPVDASLALPESCVPGLLHELARVRADQALLDGVLVAVDERGRPSRTLLAEVLAGAAKAPLQFYAFDLLHFDAFDLRPLPLLERKAALRAVLPPRARALLFVDHVVGSGEQLVRTVVAAGLPGVIAKRASSPYASGAAEDWRRIRALPDAAVSGLALGDALQRATADVVRRTTRVQLSNLDKVYWPEHGYTKGDLLSWYEQAADVLLPYLRDRPVHLYRWPDGITGKSFYQQSAPEGCPEWVRTETIQRHHKEAPIQQMLAGDRDTLLWLINLGSIDLHPWMSHWPTLESPDYAVIDLDPKSAPFGDVVKIAREVGKLLRGIGLRPLLKTSGASGLHVHVPLIAGYTYDQARTFCEAVARVVAKANKDIATVERSLANRGGRVYIDFGQNRRGQTIVPPYAVRPQPGATVSAPLDWDELTSDLHPSQFTIKTMPARLARYGDRFRALLDDRQDLTAAIGELEHQIRRR